jgi:hypothetical protein
VILRAFSYYVASSGVPPVAPHASRQYLTSCQAFNNKRCSISAVAVRTRLLKLPIILALAEGKPGLSQRPARKYDGRQKWRLRWPDIEPSWLNRRSENCQLKMLLIRFEFGGAEMLSLHCGYVVAWNVITSLRIRGGVECYHFTADSWWRWDVVISLWMCGGAGILSLHCGCVMALEFCYFTADVW